MTRPQPATTIKAGALIAAIGAVVAILHTTGMAPWHKADKSAMEKFEDRNATQHDTLKVEAAMIRTDISTATNNMKYLSDKIDNIASDQKDLKQDIKDIQRLLMRMERNSR